LFHPFNIPSALYPLQGVLRVTLTDDQLHRICEVLSRTFGWVAEADTVEQKGLRASVVLYCVRADLLGTDTLEKLGAKAEMPQAVVDELVSDFCHTIGW
jgi:hypothetical protein